MHRNDSHAGKRCAIAPSWCRKAILSVLLAAAGGHAFAVTIAEKARESGCANKPVAIISGFYKCNTASGAEAFFNVPGESRGPDVGSTKATTAPTPSGFQRVDPATQKSRDDVRRKVLTDELSTEEQLLAEARTAYANGAPVPLAEEQSNAEKYRERIARLRQAVQLHERNIEALKKEIAITK
jgi:hypothetical protein